MQQSTGQWGQQSTGQWGQQAYQQHYATGTDQPYGQYQAPQHTQASPYENVQGDESLPWRRPKVRSRSLQPGGERSIADYPWLRQRDRSMPRQEQMYYGRNREPIRPWIEEVICLKRTELRRKIVERAELETVLLKASQIERKEIIRAQIVEHVDLKRVQQLFERGNYANMQEAHLAVEEELIQKFEDETQQLQQLKHEEDLSILELTKEIDALVKKDYEQKTQTHKAVKTERVSRKFSLDQVQLRQQQHEQEELLLKQTLSALEDSSMLRLDLHDQTIGVQLLQERQIGVPWARGLKQQQTQQVNVSHLEDSSILSLAQSEAERRQTLEKAVPWKRGPKPSQPTTAQLQHVEDSNILRVDERSRIEQSQLEQHEQPVAWRRGRQPAQPAVAQTTHVEDSNILDVRQTEAQEFAFNETPVAWKRGPKPQQPKPQTQPIQHIEDTTILDLDKSTTEDIHRPDEQVLDETPVAWVRGQKKKPQPVPVQEPQPASEEEDEELHEVPTPWVRGRKPIPQAPAGPLKPILRAQSSFGTDEELVGTVEQIAQDLPEEKPTDVAVVKKKRTANKKKAAQTNIVEALASGTVDVEDVDDETIQRIPDEKPYVQYAQETSETDAVHEIIAETVQPQVDDVVKKTKKTKKKTKSLQTAQSESEDIVDEATIELIERAPSVEEVIEDVVAEVIVDQPIEQIKTTTIPETQETASVEAIQVQQKPVKKTKKPKTTKPLVTETETFDVIEQIEDTENTEEAVLEEITQSSIQLRPADVKPSRSLSQTDSIEQTVEEESEEFRKDIDVTVTSSVVKKQRRRVVVDDAGQPLHELELISQKRVPEGVELVETIQEAHTKTTTIGAPAPKAVLKPPRFLKKLQPVECQPDAPTVLQCKIDGTPFPEIKWFFNDKELFASERYVFTVTEKVATLEIVRVTPMDVGIYTCQARNDAGVATSRANVILGKSLMDGAVWMAHVLLALANARSICGRMFAFLDILLIYVYNFVLYMCIWYIMNGWTRREMCFDFCAKTGLCKD